MALALPSLIHVTDGTLRQHKGGQGVCHPSLNQVCLQLIKGLQIACDKAILGTDKSSYAILVHCIENKMNH
jgi:hypothetical protein